LTPSAVVAGRLMSYSARVAMKRSGCKNISFQPTQSTASSGAIAASSGSVRRSPPLASEKGFCATGLLLPRRHTIHRYLASLPVYGQTSCASADAPHFDCADSIALCRPYPVCLAK